MVAEDQIILVVDDDRTARFLATQALEPFGFRVEIAETGARALALMSRMSPDVALLDLDVPGVDGFELCRRLRQTTGGRDIPIIMMSGMEDPEAVEKSFRVGATDFVEKPINWIALAHRIRYMVEAGVASKALRRSERKLSNAQRIARLAWWEWDIVNNRLSASEEFYKTLGIPESEFEGSYDAFVRCMHPEDRAKVGALVDETLSGGGEFSIDYRVIRPDGSERIVHQRAMVEVNDVGAPVRVSGIFQDITERIKVEREVKLLVYYDSITGLPNRKLFNERFNLVIEQAKRHNRRLALLFLDLDRFKRVNETFGLASGDELIRQVARRLTASVRKTDSVTRSSPNDQEPTVARLGGDEFMILLSEVEDVPQVARIAERLVEAVHQPVTLQGHEIVPAASIGTALYPHDGKEPDELLRNANAAMHHAKQGGGNRYQFYSEEMNRSMLERLILENAMHRALVNGEFVVYYQPQIAIATQQVVGAEALIRWQHPEKGLVPPVQFIPLAEESGLIVPMGEWVLRTVCTQARRWREQGFPPVRVGVNVSGRQFSEKDFVRSLASVIMETRADARWLEIELTESMIMSDAEASRQSLLRLKEIGVRLSVDDFGTGYSSLSYLRRFPLDTIKIDRSFLSGVPDDADQTAITKAIIALARNLNLNIIAEGVETWNQFEFLREQRCDEAQGYLFSKPVPEEEFLVYLQQGRVIPES